VHGHQRAAFDAGGRVADDVLEVHGGQIVQHLLHAFLRQRVLVAGLRGGQHEQVVALLVLDQGLVQVGFALDDVDQVIDHAALAAHDQVEVAQADVEVDHCGLVAAQARPEAKLALVVVLPTPPLPEVTTTILAMFARFL
jgi:hypothetical protein